MDSNHSSTSEGLTFLTECVSDGMTAVEAADATCSCWTKAEEALAPVIGRDGLGILFRQGEEVAERRLGVASPRAARDSVSAFCDWVGSLAKPQAIAACQAFLISIESYLVSLVGRSGLRRLLKRRKRQPTDAQPR